MKNANGTDESPNQEQMNHLLESKRGASVPYLQTSVMMPVIHTTK